MKYFLFLSFFLLSSVAFANNNDLESNITSSDYENHSWWTNLKRNTNSSPAISVSAPTGFSGSEASISIGFTGLNRVRYSDYSDAVLSLGLNLGNPKKYLGFNVTANMFDVFNTDSLGKSFGVSASVSRLITDTLSVAIGANNIALFGDAEDYQMPSYYLAATKIFGLSSGRWFPSMSLTAGAGNGTFNTEDKSNDIINDIKDNWKTFGWFASASVSVRSWLNVIGTYNGQNLDAGLSVTPFSKHAITLTGSAVDLLEDQSGDGIRYSTNVSYAHKL